MSNVMTTEGNVSDENTNIRFTDEDDNDGLDVGVNRINNIPKTNINGSKNLVLSTVESPLSTGVVRNK